MLIFSSGSESCEFTKQRPMALPFPMKESTCPTVVPQVLETSMKMMMVAEKLTCTASTPRDADVMIFLNLIPINVMNDEYAIMLKKSLTI